MERLLAPFFPTCQEISQVESTYLSIDYKPLIPLPSHYLLKILAMWGGKSPISFLILFSFFHFVPYHNSSIFYFGDNSGKNQKTKNLCWKSPWKTWNKSVCLKRTKDKLDQTIRSYWVTTVCQAMSYKRYKIEKKKPFGEILAHKSDKHQIHWQVPRKCQWKDHWTF